MKIQTTYLPFMYRAGKAVLVLLLGVAFYPADASSPGKAFKLENFVSTSGAGYKKFSTTLRDMAALDKQIRAKAVGDAVDFEDPVVASLNNQKAQIESEFIKELGDNSPRFYKGDSLWYYLALRSPETFKLLSVDWYMGLFFHVFKRVRVR